MKDGSGERRARLEVVPLLTVLPSITVLNLPVRPSVGSPKGSDSTRRISRRSRFTYGGLSLDLREQLTDISIPRCPACVSCVTSLYKRDRFLA
jgi:hypothetical protein